MCHQDANLVAIRTAARKTSHHERMKVAIVEKPVIYLGCRTEERKYNCLLSSGNYIYFLGLPAGRPTRPLPAEPGAPPGRPTKTNPLG